VDYLDITSIFSCVGVNALELHAGSTVPSSISPLLWKLSRLKSIG